MSIKGIFINCPYPSCKKMLLKNAYLRNGSGFTMKCYFCGEGIELLAEAGEIKLRMLNPPVYKPVDNSQIDDDEDDGVVFL